MGFFDEVRGAATTASSQVTKVLSGNSAVTQGIASATPVSYTHLRAHET